MSMCILSTSIYKFLPFGKLKYLKYFSLSNIFFVFIYLLVSHLFWVSKLDTLNIGIKIIERVVKIEEFNYLNDVLKS